MDVLAASIAATNVNCLIVGENNIGLWGRAQEKKRYFIFPIIFEFFLLLNFINYRYNIKIVDDNIFFFYP